MESAYEKLKLEASKASRMHNTFRIFTEPIHWAAITGNLPAVRALLDSGVDADKAATSHLIFESGVCLTKGQIALRYAAMRGHLEVVKALLEAGADVNQDVNQQDKYGNTALGEATGQGSTLVVMELIKAGADVNLTCSDMGCPP